jgi:hypothetical protein
LVRRLLRALERLHGARALVDHHDGVADRYRSVAQAERQIARGPDDADGDGESGQDDGEPTEHVAHAPA